MTDQRAEFLSCVKPHVRRLHAVARQYAVRADDAEDLVQEALLRAWRGFSSADALQSSRAWLTTILRNVAFEWHRTASRRIRLVSGLGDELTEVAAAEWSDPLAALPALTEEQFRELLDEKIVAALDALDASFREVIVLSVAGEMTYREIAQVLDCPVGTVMSRMARARRSLRERLAHLAGTRRGARERLR